MKTGLLLLYQASILFSVVMAFVFRKHLGSRKLFIMLPYLFFVFFQETILAIITSIDDTTSTSVVYNIYKPSSVLVFTFIYYSIPFMSKLKMLIIVITGIYLLVTLVNYCFIESIFTTSSYLNLARGFVITFCAVLFLFSYFGLDNLEEEKFWHPLIWVTAGVVIFYPVVTLSLYFHKYLASRDATLYGLKLYHMIPQVMSIFMYCCFSYAFYLCQKKN